MTPQALTVEQKRALVDVFMSAATKARFSTEDEALTVFFAELRAAGFFLAEFNEGR